MIICECQHGVPHDIIAPPTRGFPILAVTLLCRVKLYARGMTSFCDSNYFKSQVSSVKESQQNRNSQARGDMFHRPAAPCCGDWRDCAVAQLPHRTSRGLAQKLRAGTTRASQLHLSTANLSRTRTKGLEAAPQFPRTLNSTVFPKRARQQTLSCSRRSRLTHRLHSDRTPIATAAGARKKTTPQPDVRLHFPRVLHKPFAPRAESFTPHTQHNVRAHPRKHPYKRRPALLAPSQTARPHTARRTRKRRRSALRQALQSPPPRIQDQFPLRPARNRCQRPGLQRRRRLGRVPCV